MLFLLVGILENCWQEPGHSIYRSQEDKMSWAARMEQMRIA